MPHIHMMEDPVVVALAAYSNFAVMPGHCHKVYCRHMKALAGFQVFHMPYMGFAEVKNSYLVTSHKDSIDPRPVQMEDFHNWRQPSGHRERRDFDLSCYREWARCTKGRMKLPRAKVCRNYYKSLCWRPPDF